MTLAVSGCRSHAALPKGNSDPPVSSPQRFPSQQTFGTVSIMNVAWLFQLDTSGFCARSGLGSTGSLLTRTAGQVEKPVRRRLVAPLHAQDSSTDRDAVLRTRVPFLPYARLHRCVMRAPVKAGFHTEGLWKRGPEGVRVRRLDRCEIVWSTIPAASSVGRGWQRSSLRRSLPRGHRCAETSERGCQIRSSRIYVVKRWLTSTASRLRASQVLPRVVVFGAKRGTCIF